MVSPLRIVLPALLVAWVALVLPARQRRRDDQHFLPPVRSQEELLALGACAGHLTIEHSSATLDRLQDTTKGGRRPIGTVRLHYVTTRCTKGASSDKEHVLLVHGTGLSSKIYTHDESGNNQTLWNFLRNKGYDVTAVDVRGHGLSEITDGPYSTELLAADLAALVRRKFPSTRIHCHGLSAGFGACMAMAIFDSDITKTISGNGFLFDRTDHDWFSYLFSLPLFNRLLGMDGILKIGELMMTPKNFTQPGIEAKSFHHCHMDGYILLAESWFHFNNSRFLPTLTIPTLILHPEYDDEMGYSKEIIDKEVTAMPPGMGRVLEFPGYSHCMVLEKDGAQKTASAVHAFIDEKTS